MPNKKEQEFDFTGILDEDEEAAPMGSPKEHFSKTEGRLREDETATSGSPDEVPTKLIHQGLTREQIEMAQAAAQSRKGLDMGAFAAKTGIVQIDFDQLLAFKLPPVS